MRVCLIAEKHSLALAVMPAIRSLHPDLEPDAFACSFVNPYVHLNTCFRYPRGLGWNDFPYTGDARYVPFSFEWPSRDGKRRGLPRLDPRLVLPEHGTPGRQAWARPWPDNDSHPEALARMRTADLIYAAMDPTDSSWLALDRAIEALGCGAKVRIAYMAELCPERIIAAFENPHLTGDQSYLDRTRRARISRRFDYAYQVNALAVHGRTMRAAGAGHDAPVPSKYGLQTLYHLRDVGPRHEGHVLDDMQRWVGTGRHAGMQAREGGTRGIASCASRVPILQSLAEAGLTVRHGKNEVALSELGTRFLDMVHPDSEDADLPFRIEEWKRLAEADAVPKVDRYLRTFFGKQIRFLARKEVAATPGPAPVGRP